MNNYNKTPVQFTKLTRDDIDKHRGEYMRLLLPQVKRTLGNRGKELHKAMQLFYETFKTN